MSVTYVSAAHRDAWRAVESARRVDTRHAVLAVTSLLSLAAITLSFYGRHTADMVVAAPSEGVGPIDLNAVSRPAVLAPMLAPVFPDASARRLAEANLYRFIAARRDRGERLPNVGVLLEARGPAGDTAGPILTREQLAALKPHAVVRTYDTHRQRVVLWGAVYLACVWIVALLWWVRGIRGDYVLLCAAHMLTGLGFAALLSRQDPLRDTELFVRFAQLTAASFVLFALVSAIDFRRVARIGLSYLPLAGALTLSVLLILFGQGPAGSNAKVNLGPMQPVEFIRLLLALFLAGYFARRWELLRDVRADRVRSVRVPAWLDLPRVDYVLPVVSGVAAALLLFFLQKDLGPALFLSFVFLMTYAIARNRASLAVIGLAAVIAGFYLGYVLNVSSTLTARVAMWQSSWDNAIRGGDQIAQAIWGLSTGGLFGTGLGLGDTAYVPAGFTDLILAAIGEELGFVGLLAVTAIFVTITWRGFSTALGAADDYGFFLATILTLFLTLPVLVMAAGMLGIVPLTGVVTPFLSFGGSAMLANFVALGTLTAIRLQPSPGSDVTGPFHVAVRRLGACLGAVALGIVVALFNIQVLAADTYMVRPHLGMQADGYRRYQYNPRINDVLATIPRGTVFDRRGLPLATSDETIARSAPDAYTASGVESAGCAAFSAERCYPLAGAAFHLLGDVRNRRNWSATNTAYVERDSQARLRGFDDHATTVLVPDASGRPAATVRRDYRELIPLLRHRRTPDHPEAKAFRLRPRDLTLTIDAPFQAAVSNIVSKYAARSASGHAAAVVLNPDTGDILAIASYPFPQMTDSRSSAGEDESEALIDRARFGLYVPGSTFKIVTAAAALRHHVDPGGTTFLCSLQAKGRVGATIRGWGVVRDDVRETRPHGTINMHEGLARSCNAYFAQLAVRVGPQSIWETAKLLGISVARDDSMARLRATLPQAGYGQGDVVATPLRMARLVAAVASKGILREAQVERESSPPAPSLTLLSPQAASILGRDLRDAVLNGTGRILRNHRWRIAGKTGTAEVNGAPSHAWFVGYAPYGRATQRVAFAVVVENAGYGGLAAAPAAGEIVDAAAATGLIR